MAVGRLRELKEMIRVKRFYPQHLIDTESERELISGAFRAAQILDDTPDHEGARCALTVIRTFPTSELAMPEHQAIIAAMRVVLDRTGTLSPALVLRQLRVDRQMNAIRLLPDAATYGLAPVNAILHHVRHLRNLAAARAKWRALQDAQADMIGERASWAS